ncbi:MAG TPA: hypothetical protein VNC78_12670 [Actinomycetota bacterium]|nr:hypothetical protein [Actinomycetota bacterium]
MPRARWSVLAALLLAVVAGLPSVTPVAAGPTAGGMTSDNVEYLKHIPFEAGGPSGARLLGKHLYVAGFKNFSIYDIADPENPELLSITPTGFQFPNEDVDTNGKILLIQEETPRGMLHIFDVEDKQNPAKLAEFEAGDHTFSCVLDCQWAYGGYGSIIDLRDPENPSRAGNWGYSPSSPSFDVTEVSPGIVLTASRPLRLLDARKDPAAPKTVAYGHAPDDRLMHAARWPDGGKDDFVLVTGETPFSVRCDEDSSAFMTFDARRWKKSKTFSMIDEYRMTNGTYVDGRPPANVIGCSALWFDDHPDFSDGGLVAAAFLEHGVRVLSVDPRGKISEVGWFEPHGGSVVASYWLSADVIYAIDAVRGIDILRYTGDA